MAYRKATVRHIEMLIFSVSLLCTSAAAQFETRSSSPIIYEPQSVAVADFNHDGKLDVASTAYTYGQVAVLLGRGDGTFQSAVYYDLIDSELVSIAAADFNGDGNIDLAVVDQLGQNFVQNISILLGNGDGTFRSPVPYPTTEFPTFVDVGDFNNDGKPDLIVVDGQYVSVMLGNGDGTFQPPKDNSIFSSNAPLGLGDFDRDGNLDVAVPESPGGLGLGILLGNGDGTFREGAEYALGSASTVTVGDFNGDHKLDLAAIVAGSNPVQIFLGNGDGTFQLGASYFANYFAGLSNADVNGDGKVDLLFVTLSLPIAINQLTVMLGNGDGTFQPPVSYGSFSYEVLDLAVGDFNRDHQPDVVVADSLGNAVDVLLNTGVVSFSPTTPLSFSPQLLGISSAPQSVTLTNTSKTALSIGSKQVSAPFKFASGTTCGSSVAPGAKCTLSLIFHPTTMGLKSGLVTLNDSASGKPQVVELSGTGTTLTVSPPQLDFGKQKVHTLSPPQNVTVTNTGSTAVSITGIAMGGAYPTDYVETNTCGSQLDAGATCTISISFGPGFGGTITATAVINGPGGALWQQVPVTGKGD
ncbi:MAG TPA: FG-GAP-like repeat-containing protein [Terriglobales bacterium]|nr:FG-GAP-like repeat-containing protein [Terriglobales bacterium]